jgi:retron-type reverse transcriptase
MKNNQTHWQEYFLDIGISSDIVERYMQYVYACYFRGIPPIFEERHLAGLLGRDIQTLHAFINGTEHFYRTFKIKKRSGGSREISAPYPSLLECQSWINKNILSTVQFPNHVIGYVKGRSIIDNAKIHCRRDVLLKIDIEDFFPTIKFRRVMKVFTDFGYPRNVAFAMSKICCLNDQLPQGSAASPAISNIVCKKMDEIFYKSCKSKGLRYTRYSDDITISGKAIEKGNIRYFFEIIEAFGFRVNSKKVRILNAGDRKIVTGLDITNGYPRVSREFRRNLMRDVYFVWSAGLQTHVARQRIFEPSYIDQLVGRANFWRSVEPDNPQMKKVIGRLSLITAIG